MQNDGLDESQAGIKIARRNICNLRYRYHPNAEDESSIPGSGRSLAEGNGHPFQYSCLGNPMDRGVWWTIGHGVAKELDTA